MARSTTSPCTITRSRTTRSPRSRTLDRTDAAWAQHGARRSRLAATRISGAASVAIGVLTPEDVHPECPVLDIPPHATGSYAVVWWLSVFFGVASAVINLPIVEKPVVRAAAAPASA